MPGWSPPPLQQTMGSSNFPSGPVIKNPPSNTGDTGSIPGQGTKIPFIVGQLGLHATITEPGRLN